MNKKALFGMSLVAFVSIIAIVTIGLAFGIIFGLDIVSKGMATQDQVIKDIYDISSINKIILDFLNTKSEQGITITDLIILSVKNNDYKNLKNEAEKYFENLPEETYKKFAIESNEKVLFEFKQESFNKIYEKEIEGKNLHKINFVTPLINYPELKLIFSIRNVYEKGLLYYEIE